MNNHLITKFVKYILYGLVTISSINIFSNIMQINLINDYFVKDLYSDNTFSVLANNNDFRVNIINSVFFILIISSYIIIGRWFYISSKINYFLGIKELTITPGWSVGWYFIPIASLVMPYRSLKETFKASFNSEDWQNRIVPYDFPIWWITFLAGNTLGYVSFRMYLNLGETYAYEKLIQLSYIDISADTCLIINAFFLLRIVDTIFNNHKDVNFEMNKV